MRPLILITFAASLVSGCVGYRVDTHVTLKNDTGLTLTEVVLHVSGNEVWRGDLSPNQKKVVNYEPVGDGSFQVIGALPNGSSFLNTPVGYTTKHDGQDHQVHLLPDGSVVYELGKSDG